MIQKPNTAEMILASAEVCGFRGEIQAELDQLLNWWIVRLYDDKNGGFFGRIDGHGKLFPKADKGVIFNTRMLWTFSAAARQINNVAYRKMADRAYLYVADHFVDPVEGGVFWMLDYKGEPVSTRKQIYAQAFAIYAFSEYYALTGSKAVLEQALELFWLIEKYSFDKKRGGYFEAFDREWHDLDDLRLSEKDANEAKTMNTHLHVLEAYTNLFRVSNDNSVKEALEKLIVCFVEKFVDPATHHLHLFFDENWNVKSNIVSFGHDIECSWLLWEAAEVLGDEKLIATVRPIAVHMAAATLREGTDALGSLYNENIPGQHLDTDKHWWPQAEAIVGFWNAWEISQEEKYVHAAMQCWDFIKKYLLDKENGEWHWRVDIDGKPILSEDKAGPWKAPYHNGRMCMELLRRTRVG